MALVFSDKKNSMKKYSPLAVVLSLLLITSLSSCSNYGKKVKIEGTKGEVYYKDGATAAEAKKIGDFLKETGFLSKDKVASIQLVKEGNDYVVRFVYNKEFYEKTPDLEDLFKVYGARMSKDLFGGQKVNIALSDNKFKDFKKIPYDEASAKTLELDVANEPFVKADFDSDTAGGVEFYWKGISDEESKTIADYIVKTGFFSGGTAEIYMSKHGDRYLLRFPVKKEYQQDAPTINAVEKIAKDIKENVFTDRPYTFQMTDENLNVLKSFEH
jgi:hypothetical protein